VLEFRRVHEFRLSCAVRGSAGHVRESSRHSSVTVCASSAVWLRVCRGSWINTLTHRHSHTHVPYMCTQRAHRHIRLYEQGAHCPILLRPRDNPRCLPLPFFLSDDGYTHGSSRQRGDGLLPSAHHKLCHARAHSELKLDVRFRMVCWLPRHSKPSKSSDANATVIIDEGVSPMAISKLARARHVT
jgi:hypothetical protein